MVTQLHGNALRGKGDVLVFLYSGEGGSVVLVLP